MDSAVSARLRPQLGDRETNLLATVLDDLAERVHGVHQLGDPARAERTWEFIEFLAPSSLRQPPSTIPTRCRRVHARRAAARYVGAVR